MTVTPTNTSLYERVKREAKSKFQTYPSIYANSWIVKEYKKRGGKYAGPAPRNSGLRRWYRERWVDLNRPIKENGKIKRFEKCGRTSKDKKSKYPLCRPSIRVSRNTPRTYREISKKSINKAKKAKVIVKHKGRIQFGKGKAQYKGTRSTVMVKVPTNVRRWAAYAFKLRKLGFRGATETGWKRARQLATRDSIPIEDVRYMHAWFSRHVYTSYPGFKKWMDAGRPKDKKWHNKRSVIAIVTWGGPAGLRWVNSAKVLATLTLHFNKQYHAVKAKKK
jgi:hypothetical protein